MKFDLTTLVRDNIKNLLPYASARQEFSGKASVFLDANENAYGSPQGENSANQAVKYNRYPDPLQWPLKLELAQIKGVPAQNICLGNGSDELIDLVIRIFCNPGMDNILVCPPTYGMYTVNAAINDIETKKVPLTADFQLDIARILDAIDPDTKLIFICSPNNPTGNSMKQQDIIVLLNHFRGIVVIDEAYIDYSPQQSFLNELINYPNLVVMQTLSKAWGLAGLRLGMCFASKEIIDLFNKVKPPYNINQASQTIALNALQHKRQVNEWIKEVILQRELLGAVLCNHPSIKEIYESDANFLLLKVNDANLLYEYLTRHGIVVRNRTNEPGCQNCLRISIGKPDENQQLLRVLKKFTK